MGMLTIVFGVLLLGLGVAGFAATGSSHYTALIPAGFGLGFIVLGLLARKDSLRKHAMHVAAMLGLLGFAGNLSALPSVVSLLGGGTVERPAAVIARGMMAFLCAIFVALCVRSFISARRARKAAAQ